jgi:hypothetical protein
MPSRSEKRVVDWAGRLFACADLLEGPCYRNIRKYMHSSARYIYELESEIARLKKAAASEGEGGKQ